MANVAFRSAKGGAFLNNRRPLSSKPNTSAMLGQVFDPQADFHIGEHCRPHWSQTGTVVFITFRTQDSIPLAVVGRWEREKQEWLRARGHDACTHWSDLVAELSAKEEADFNNHFQRCREDFLDTCQGECWLRKPELSKVVADALLHFDGVQYQMGDFVIMPNHVHLLAVFGDVEGMIKICDSWLHFSARRINQLIGRRGKFWQQEPFDHLVRSPEQYEYLRQYIADNPFKARLKPGDYFYRRFRDK